MAALAARTAPLARAHAACASAVRALLARAGACPALAAALLYRNASAAARGGADAAGAEVCAGPCHEAFAALLAEAEDACGAAGRAVLQWRATGTLPQTTAPMTATTAGAAAGWEWDGAAAVPSFRARLFEGPPSLAAFDHFPAAFDLDRHLRALLAAVANARLAERLVCTRNYYGRTCDDVASGLAAAAAAACAPLRSLWAFDAPALGAPAYELSPMTTLSATANQCVSLPHGANQCGFPSPRGAEHSQSLPPAAALAQTRTPRR